MTAARTNVLNHALLIRQVSKILAHKTCGLGKRPRLGKPGPGQTDLLHTSAKNSRIAQKEKANPSRGGEVAEREGFRNKSEY